MKLQTRHLLFGGALALGGTMYGWYLYGKQSQPVKESKSISKELIIKILREQERELYPVVKCISSISAVTLQYPEAKDMSLEQIRSLLFHKFPKLEEKYNAIGDKTVEKYGLNREKYFDVCNVTFKNDEEVQELIKKRRIALLMAYRGIPQELASTIPDFLTPKKTLQVQAKIKEQEAEKVRKIFESVDKEGRSFWEDKERVVRFLLDAPIEIFLDDEKRKILDAEGLDAFEEHPERILDTALECFNLDPKFRQKYRDLERYYFGEEEKKREHQFSKFFPHRPTANSRL